MVVVMLVAGWWWRGVEAATGVVEGVEAVVVAGFGNARLQDWGSQGHWHGRRIRARSLGS